MEPVRPGLTGTDPGGQLLLGWVLGDGRLLQSAASPWQGLGRCHLAGLRLGGSGGCFVITQWVLATAEGGEHAVPELEGKGHESESGSTQSVCSKLVWLARFAYYPFPLCPSQPSLPGQIWLSGGNLLNICDPTQRCPGLNARGLSLMTFRDALCVPRAVYKLSHLTQEFGILPLLWMENLGPENESGALPKVTLLESSRAGIWIQYA